MDDAGKDFLGLILILAILWFAWFITGGPEREEARGGVFLKPLAPVDTGETYGSLPFLGGGSSSGERDEISSESGSLFSNSVFIGGHTGTKNSDEEYVEIRAGNRNAEPMLITGWRLQNKVGFASQIPHATAVHLLGRVNTAGPVFLSSGERAYVATGRSPVGSSFKENICSGYLEQFQDFSPPIQKKCPSPLSTINLSAEGLESECVSYINRLNRCETPTNIPDELSPSCRSFITTHISHNACVVKNQSENNFYTGTWRLFLGLDRDLWNNVDDTIRLIDSSGGVVDSESY